MPKSYNTTIENRIGCIWITFKDSIDMDNYKSIEDDIFYIVKQEATQNIVLDLSKTSALFSSGIGVIIRLHAFAQKTQRNIFLVNVSQKVFDGLITTGLDTVLTIFSTEEKLKQHIDFCDT